MIYTKPWEYRLGMTMMVFGALVVIFMAVLAGIRLFQGDIIFILYVLLGILNFYYVKKYFFETKEYRERRRRNG